MKKRHLIALAWLALASPAIATQGTGCMPTTGTVSGLTMAQDINAAIAALQANSLAEAERQARAAVTLAESDARAAHAAAAAAALGRPLRDVLAEAAARAERDLQ